MDNWPKTVRSLHWLIFVLLVAAWASVEMHEQFPRGSELRAFFMQAHFHLGLSVMLLTAIRFLVRIAGDKPQAVGALMTRMARMLQWMFYPMLLALPLTGLLGAGYSGKSVAVLRLFVDEPLLPGEEAYAELFEDFHEELLFTLLMAMLIAHVGAALFHHFVRKDATLRSMLGRASTQRVQGRK